MKQLFQKYFQKFKQKNNALDGLCFTTHYELPVHNWFQVNKEGNIQYLFKDHREPTKKETPLLYDLYYKLMDDYIQLFGFSKTSLAIFRKKKEIALQQLDYIISNDKTLYTLIEINEIELQSMLQQEIDVNLYELKPKVEKIQGRYIDFKKETVYEWNMMLKQLN